MEYLIMAAVSVAFLIVVFGLEGARARREEKRFIQYLYQDYGKLIQKEYALERFVRMGSFFERRPEKGQIDDITWNDLGMDEIFKRMNYTLSASGEEYLYYTLRTLKRDEQELKHFEEVVDFFGTHADERVNVQLAARELGYTGKFSLYDYLDNLDVLGNRTNTKHILQNLLFLVFIAMLWVEFSLGVMGIVGLVIYNIISYFKEKGEIDPYITSFAYVMRLMDSCRKLEKVSIPVCDREWARMKDANGKMRRMQRNSFWVMSPNRGNNTSGDIISVFMDYIRMVFHVDIIKFNSMLKILREHTEDVDTMIQVVGYLETAIAVWAFRDSLENGWCVPEFIDQSGLCMEEGYHPLLTNPVKNSIAAEKGILLTGSNASGKSTFLKTVALNAILGQTIHTCTAKQYKADFYDVYSSMSLRDDLDSGESYYIVEIKALKRILDAAKDGRQVLCFVDEVLRGTNTVERIAASTQILKSLSGFGIFCFAATHDIELTELLKNEFENYHFEEDVRDGDVFFNYRLQPGKATTRNAIKLLELMGYDGEIIRKASTQAEKFVATGVWE